ncbi:hypothetical protein H9Q72_011929 [Fusarium xylarioides]|uniref:Methyltransferase n=1 Tax=Fusarium xylarioides TaxID=221167 RepID=A0A9P7HIG8_9HYPO|nr:hypothetical protein H9Q70_010824 [Fusarium xylarioides]KAG5759964.1 hypothetical protein H9Q72_011929 [Fusarium xylarioides]KAG5802479.1 hypothetical protein H9Q71_012932 [Fusarium xylarioides]KAG5813060.1 hypothetical protein H9Q74_012854 [Fusarium xylarioides]
MATQYSTTSTLGYLERLDLYNTEKPYASAIKPWNTPGASSSNLSIVNHDIKIHDMRRSKQGFSTDIQGFELGTFPATLTDDELRDQASLRTKYFPEAEEFLKMRYGAELVFIFDATVRNAARREHSSSAVLRSVQVMGASVDVHVDQTPASVYRRLQRQFPHEYQQLKHKRIQVINIWRTLVEPLRDRPLALCDWRSTSPQDFVACDLPAPGYNGEVFQVYHNPAHEWWFASDMCKKEVILIKMYDSDSEKPGSSIAMCAPHSSFKWKDAPGINSPRESMEIRAIIVS